MKSVLCHYIILVNYIDCKKQCCTKGFIRQFAYWKSVFSFSVYNKQSTLVISTSIILNNRLSQR